MYLVGVSCIERVQYQLFFSFPAVLHERDGYYAVRQVRL